MRYIILVSFLFFNLLASAQKTYYLNSSGRDNNNGSFERPWKTVAAANKFNFEPGDSLLFAGGQLFGKLDLQADDEGLAMASYNGVATVGGLFAYNVGNISITNLNFTGLGATGNNEAGIFFYMDSLSGDLNNIFIENVTVTKFGETGILFGAEYTANGYNNVKVTNSSLNNNGKGGFASYGYNNQYNHTKIYLYKVKAFQNYGRTDVTATHTGSGIIVANVDSALVEYCEAYENGKYNRSTIGGPQGIWCFNAKNTTIQYCVSYSNNAGRQYDGGGFDIDGGSQNCIIQYCYSYNNDGPGFAMFEAGSSNQFQNNIIRYNISENDARRNTHGAIMFWSYSSANKIKKSQIYNNTVYVTPSATGYPSAIYYKGPNIANLTWYNNIFYTIGSVKILRGTSASTHTYSNNNYYTVDSVVNFKVGGVSVDPMFTKVGGGKVGYKLNVRSPMINTGKESPVSKDFEGTLVPYNGGYDIGAYEYNATLLPKANAGSDKTIKLPANSITLNGSGSDEDGSITQYNWTKTAGPTQFTIQTNNTVATTVSNLVEGTYIFRLSVTDNDGATGYDEVQVIVATAPPPPGKISIKVNLYGGTNSYNNTEWNNWNVSASLNSGKLKYSDTSASLVSASITKNTISDNGSTYGGTMAPAEVLRYTSNASVARTLTLSGLSTNASYSLELYASRNNTGNSTVFTINGIAVSILTDKNLINKAVFNALTPTTAGQLVIGIQNSNSYNYLNGFTLIETGHGTPTVTAGSDQRITLPGNNLTLNGSAKDEDGTITNFSWSKIAGPSTFSFGTPGAPSTTVNNLVEGTYTFRLTVTDNDGATAFDEVQVIVNAAPAPAGTRYVKVNLFGGTNPYNNREWNNWNVSSSLNSGALKYSDASTSSISATLSKHTLSDNGSTYGGGMAPAEVLRYTSYTTTARTLTVSGLSISKTYSIELYASRNNTGNSTIFTTDGTAVTVLTDKNLTNKASFINLTPNAQGQLVLNIQNLNSYNYLNGFILTENAPPAGTPTVNAGTDQTITLPQNTVTLTGGGADENGTIEGFNWSKVAGPTQFSFSTQESASTTLSNLVEGTYIFRLTVTDNDGIKAFDDVAVTVNPESLTPGTREIKVNLYGGTNSYNNTEWNNWDVSASLNASSLKYATGRSSPITASITKNTLADNGSTYGGTMAPPEVLRYTSYGTVARTLTLGGLSSAATYSLELYASRNNTGNSTTFTVNGTTATVLTDKNLNNKVVFSGLVPTATGQLVISIQNVNSYNYLNGFILVETIAEIMTVTKQKVLPLSTEPATTFELQTFPNPTEQFTTFWVKSISNKPVNIKILDAFGRVLEIKNNVASNTSFKIGHNLNPGVYFVEAIQQGHKKTIKLVKKARQ